MSSIYHVLIFWTYWLIAGILGITLAAALLREKDRGVQATVAMLLVPVILRLLLLK